MTDDIRPTPPHDADETISHSAPPGSPTGQPASIGGYKLLGELGEGGMGTVYLAEQRQPVRRRVALKVIKLGMDTKQVVARFEAERQALAMMSHDNIAKVFDGGTTEHGQPYFVMEHVPGRSLTDHCDHHRLATAARIELFLQVCAGVQHAHHKGIIHRDLKPSNILVTVDQDRPVPKIIDFGVARAVDHRLVEATIFTEQGRMIGTPEYMSPEQAEMSLEDIDTRTDVYSLGVLLYELLVGDLPFPSGELRRDGLFEIHRKIREVEPPKPSTRLTASAATTEVASRRSTTAAALLRQVRGDLDWVVMRAMEKERSRRYPSASDLAADLERFLGDRPVLASPPSATYRLRKWARRKRGGLLTAALAAAALAVGLGSGWFVGGDVQRQDVAADYRRRAAVVAERLPPDKSAQFLEIVGLLADRDDAPAGEGERLGAAVDAFLADGGVEAANALGELARAAESRLPVFSDDPELQRQHRDSPWVAVGPADGAAYTLIRDGAGALRFATRDGLELWGPESLEDLETAFREEAQFRELWDLRDEAGDGELTAFELAFVEPTPAELGVHYEDAGVQRFGSGPGRARVYRAVVPPFSEQETDPGPDKLAVLEVRNALDRPLFFHVLSITENREVTQLWPDSGETVSDHREPRRVAAWLGLPENWPASRSLRERYVVIAADRPLRFDGYLRGGDDTLRGSAAATVVDSLFDVTVDGDGLKRGLDEDFGVRWVDLLLSR